MDQKFQFLLLGIPEMVWQTRSFGIARRQARALLFRLADQMQPVTRDTLLFLLWPDIPETIARRNLKRLLSYIRKSLPHPDLLLTSGARVTLNADLIWSDTVHFAELCAAEDETGWETAVSLYRSRFLDGFALAGSPEFDQWLGQAQRQYERIYLEVLRNLITIKTNNGDGMAAIHYAQQYLAADNLAEEIHRRLISLYGTNGDRAMALHQFEQCAMALERELGVSPLPETRAAYEAVRDGVIAASSEIMPQLPMHNLPAQTTSFIGRTREISQIATLFNDGTTRLISVIGPGGVGKTRLALEFAAAQLDTFRHGVYFVSLAPLRAAEDIVPAIAKSFNYPFQTDNRTPDQQLLGYLRHKHILLVLDNFEHLLDGVGLVNDILQAGPQLRVLTTSRERLKLSGELVFILGGMDFPETDMVASSGSPRQQGNYSAVRLFVGRARQVRPDFELGESNLQHIVRICRLAQGLPLGILLAASWIEILTPEEIVTEIGQSPDFLETDLEDIPKRQRSMRAVFDHSWLLLTELERQLFIQLSVFRGGFTRDAVQTITDARLGFLMSLVSKSFLQRTPVGRYQVHELLRQFGAEKLDQLPDKGKTLRDRHCAFYATFLQKHEADLKGYRSQIALAEIETEIENIQSAWQWAAERRGVEWLDQASNGLGRFYERRGHYSAGKQAFQLAKAKLTPGTDADGLRILAKMMIWHSFFELQLQLAGRAEFLEDQQDIGEQLQHALALLNRSTQNKEDTRIERAFALENLALHFRQIDREKSRQLAEKSLELYQEIEDRWGVANAMTLLGRIGRNLGDYEKAQHLYTESLTIREMLQDQHGIAHSYSSLSLIAMDLGDTERAEALARSSLSICHDMKDRVGTAEQLSILGLSLIFNGKLSEAQAALTESVAISNDLGAQSRQMTTSLWLGVTLSLSGHYQQALRLGRECLVYFQQAGDPWATGHAHMLLGWASLPIEAYANAEKHLTESAGIFQKLGQRDEYSQVLVYQSYAALKQGQIDQAQRYFEQALQTAAASKLFLPSMLIIGARILILIAQGEIERALELYTITMAYQSLNTVWYDDVVGKPMKYLAASLSPERASAARQRGETRDIWETIATLSSEST